MSNDNYQTRPVGSLADAQELLVKYGSGMIDECYEFRAQLNERRLLQTLRIHERYIRDLADSSGLPPDFVEGCRELATTLDEACTEVVDCDGEFIAAADKILERLMPKFDHLTKTYTRSRGQITLKALLDLQK